MKNVKIFVLSIFMTTFAGAYSQEKESEWSLKSFEYRVKAGVSLGGTSPVPLPAEIRKIENFNPLLNLQIGGEVIKTLNERWALQSGLQFENRGMETNAIVKNYQMSLVMGAQEISGPYYGKVRTTVNNSYLTLPVLAVWKPAERWGVKFGIYGSYLLKGDFSGAVSDGYLYENDPTGEQIFITNDTPYDFSDNLQKWYYGVQVGAEYRAFKHFFAAIDVTGGLNSIFEKDFETITFSMYPIYGTLSFAYEF